MVQNDYQGKGLTAAMTWWEYLVSIWLAFLIGYITCGLLVDRSARKAAYKELYQATIERRVKDGN